MHKRYAPDRGAGKVGWLWLFLLYAWAGARPVHAEEEGAWTKTPLGAHIRTRGQCLIVRARAGNAATQLNDSRSCDLPGGETLPPYALAEPYAWLPDALWAALNDAEIATCGKLGCALSGREVRIYIKPGEAPLLIQYTGPAIVIHLSTSLVDVTESTMLAMLDEIKPEPEGGGATYAAWLASLDAQQGRPCAPVLKPARNGKISLERFREVRMAAQSFYLFLFAHEIAHVVLGPACGQGEGDDLAREAACDRFAARKLLRGRGGLAMLVMAQNHTLAHYQSVRDTYLGQLVDPAQPGVFLDKFPAARWLQRAGLVLDEWERLCSAATADSDTCIPGWQRSLAALRLHLQAPLPGSCVTATASQVQQATPNPAAAACLEFDPTDEAPVKWTADGGAPLALLALRYRNHCEQSVRCAVTVWSGTVLREDGSAWVPYRSLRDRFTLDSGQVHLTNGSLLWQADQVRRAQLRFPTTRDRDLVSCSFVGAAPPPSPSGEQSLCAGLLGYVKGGTDGWKALRGAVRERDAQSGEPTEWQARLLLPGASECGIEASATADGERAKLSCTLLRSEGQEGIEQSYQTWRQQIAACLPGWSSRTRQHDNERSRLTTTRMRPADDSLELKLMLSQDLPPSSRARIYLFLDQRAPGNQ